MPIAQYASRPLHGLAVAAVCTKHARAVAAVCTGQARVVAAVCTFELPLSLAVAQVCTPHGLAVAAVYYSVRTISGSGSVVGSLEGPCKPYSGVWG